MDPGEGVIEVEAVGIVRDRSGGGCFVRVGVERAEQ